MSTRYCARCSHAHSNVGAYCPPCHRLVTGDIARRQALPVGYGGRPEEEPRTPALLFSLREDIMESAFCEGCNRWLPIRGRILGLPYCTICLDVRPMPGGWYGPRYDDDPGPWEEVAVRALEDALELVP